MRPNLLKTAELVTFTEEILNAKLHFFVQCDYQYLKNTGNYYNSQAPETIWNYPQPHATSWGPPKTIETTQKSSETTRNYL